MQKRSYLDRQLHNGGKHFDNLLSFIFNVKRRQDSLNCFYSKKVVIFTGTLLFFCQFRYLLDLCIFMQIIHVFMDPHFQVTIHSVLRHTHFNKHSKKKFKFFSVNCIIGCLTKRKSKGFNIIFISKEKKVLPTEKLRSILMRYFRIKYNF